MTIYTTIFGSYDKLNEHPDILNVRWVCITDTPIEDTKNWEIKLVNKDTGLSPRWKSSPRRFAKYYRAAPFTDDAESIFIDGSVEVVSPKFVDWIKKYDNGSGVVLFKHPQHNCIYDEAIEATTRPYKDYSHSVIFKEISHYQKQLHFPDQMGLWNSGIIYRNLYSPKVGKFCTSWLDLIDNHSLHCQLSLPVALWINKIVPGTIADCTVYNNNYFKIHPHSWES